MVSLGISSNRDAVTRDVKNISFVLFLAECIKNTKRKLGIVRHGAVYP